MDKETIWICKNCGNEMNGEESSGTQRGKHRPERCNSCNSYQVGKKNADED